MGDGKPFGSRYLLGDVLGRGAMGRVHRASVRDSDEQVAIKILREDVGSQPDVLARFIQERQLLRSVHHENVVAVHDLVVEGDQLGIVMDLVDGGDLRSAVRFPIPPTQALRLTGQIASGLSAVHAAGVVHRDMKPENILVDRSGGEIRLKLTDFGVSRLVGQTLTKVTSMIGTPGYLAPEVAAGKRPTGAADVYALGAMVFEMLCGRPPFDAENVLALIRAHAEDPVPRPQGMSDKLWHFVHGMLSKSPQDRPSADEVMKSAVELLAGDLDSGPFYLAEARADVTDVAADGVASGLIADAPVDESATVIRKPLRPDGGVPVPSSGGLPPPSSDTLFRSPIPAPPGATVQPLAAVVTEGEDKRSRRGLLVAAAVIVVLGLGVTAFAALGRSGGSSVAASATTSTTVVGGTSPLTEAEISPSSATATSVIEQGTEASPVTTLPAQVTTPPQQVTTPVVPVGTPTATTAPAPVATKPSATTVRPTPTTAKATTTTLPATTTTALTKPAVPSIAGTVNGTSISWSWSVSSTGNTPLSRYDVYLNNQLWYQGAGTALSTNGGYSSNYTLRVVVVNAGGLTAENSLLRTTAAQTAWIEIAWGPPGGTVSVFSAGPGSGTVNKIPVGTHITTNCRAYNQAIAASNSGGWWYHISAGTYAGWWTPASVYENGSGAYPATGAVWDPAVPVC